MKVVCVTLRQRFLLHSQTNVMRRPLLTMSLKLIPWNWAYICHLIRIHLCIAMPIAAIIIISSSIIITTTTIINNINIIFFTDMIQIPVLMAKKRMWFYLTMNSIWIISPIIQLPILLLDPKINKIHCINSSRKCNLLLPWLYQLLGVLFRLPPAVEVVIRTIIRN